MAQLARVQEEQEQVPSASSASRPSRPAGHRSAAADDACACQSECRPGGPYGALRNSRESKPPRLSVIIPARNEGPRIGAVLRQVRRGKPWEIIVVDGQSTDRTPEIAAAFGATVICSRPGRGRQQQVGADAATGDVLVFLHADTIPPRNFARHILRVLARPGVSGGAFRLRIDRKSRSLRLLERLVNWRSRVLQMPYGDQAIFMTARTLRRIGSFPGLPVMEDFELVRRLRRLGRIEIAPACVVTSARRWIECGIWRTTFLNQACIIAYRLGVRPARIARWRQRRRTEAPSPAFGPPVETVIRDGSYPGFHHRGSRGPRRKRSGVSPQSRRSAAAGR